MSYATDLSFDLSPVRLSYVAALRGVIPRKTEDAFTYGQTGTFDPETLICLAASNPNGRFVGIMPDEAATQEANILAGSRRVFNVSFSSSIAFLPEKLDYLCCESVGQTPTKEERDAFLALAEKHLVPGGLLVYRYQAYNNADETLRFLIAEYAPELSQTETLGFLHELKNMGASYFAEHPIAATALDKAIANNTPESFFETCGSEEPVYSGSFETLAGLLPRGFAYAGDADIGANYLELAAPTAAHESLINCQDHLLYEPIKDFALGRLVRNDIWVKLPTEQTLDKPTLFGFFTFGITSRPEKVPTTLVTNGREIDLSSPLFANLIELMCVLPTGVGDFLQHPSGKDQAPDDVLAAMQVLVAGGIAQPMRGHYEGVVSADIAHPVWSNGFNEYLKDVQILESTVRLASPIVGGAVSLSAKDALVLQALSRVGLANVSGSLQPELERLALKNPALAAQIMDSTTPTDEAVHAIVMDVVKNGMVRWYAYGILAA